MNEAGAATGAPAADEARQQIEGHASDIAAAYERARRELNDAVRTLREEVARLDFDEARTRAQRWVDDNPTLAVFLGIGAGILVGRLLSDTLRPEPPPLPVRARRQAGALAEQAMGFAGGVGAVLAEQAALAAKKAGKSGKRVSKQARVLGDELARRAQAAGAVVAEHTGDWTDVLSHRAGEFAKAASETAHGASHALYDTAHDVRKAMGKQAKHLRKKVRRKRGFADTVVDAARTATAAVVIKQVNDWVKKFR